MTRGLRTLAAITLVVALHVAALMALTQMAPPVLSPQEGPIFEIVLAPPMITGGRRAPPSDRAIRTLTPRRPQTSGDERDSPPAPAAPIFAGGAAGDPQTAARAAAQAARLRAALQQTFGCSHPDKSRLNEAERAACLARFARGAENAPYRPPLMDGDKQQTLNRAAARKAADRAYRDQTSPPLGISTTGGGPVMNPLPDL
ncbi:MAG: hypothetical protein Q8R71_03645 [Phenylobacterium sp.]|nr:hypothetical protein [Phenylobacterium sp.]